MTGIGDDLIGQCDPSIGELAVDKIPSTDFDFKFQFFLHSMLSRRREGSSLLLSAGVADFALWALAFRSALGSQRATLDSEALPFSVITGIGDDFIGQYDLLIGESVVDKIPSLDSKFHFFLHSMLSR
jgi:hypothetical protein